MTFYNKYNATMKENLCKSPVSQVTKYIGEENRFFAAMSTTVSGDDVDVQKLNGTKYEKTLVPAA